MNPQFVIPEAMHARLERAHAALGFVSDVVALLEVRSGLLGKADGTAPAERTGHAEVQAGGMAEFCSLICDEMGAVLAAARFQTTNAGARHD